MKLTAYTDFDRAFKHAISINEVANYIDELENLIAKKTNVYLANLFLARIYTYLKNFANAEKHYKNAYEISSKKESLINEIRLFKSEKKNAIQDSYSLFLSASKLNDEEKKIIEYNFLYDTLNLRSELFLHQYILSLQRLKLFNKGKIILDKFLSNNLSADLRAKFLLIKSQLLSAEGDFYPAIQSYNELLDLNKKLSVKESNLGHLEFEVAKLYAKLGQLDSAITAAERAYDFTPINSILQFITTLKGTDINDIDIDDFKLEIDDEHIDYISPMLKFDIEDFEYRDKIILENGKVTLEDTVRLYNKAKNQSNKDKSLIYPMYLEAAKAFNDLKLVDLSNQNFTDSLAQYSALKSNAIFYQYRQEIYADKPNLIKLKRLKDSACSYIEASLNVVLEGKLETVLMLLQNYLKITISYELFRNNKSDFKTILNVKSFNSVISYSLSNNDNDIVLITYQTIIHFGSVSSRIWDKISSKTLGTEEFYNHLVYLSHQKNKEKLIELLKGINNLKIEKNLKVGHIFQKFVKSRRIEKQKFENDIQEYRKVDLKPKNIDLLTLKWEVIKGDFKVFTETDFEIANEVDRIIKAFSPYLERTISERTNILYLIRTIIDKELNFIVDNTTYWGRTFFFPLLTKWKIEIDKIEKERVSQTIPILKAYADPAFVYLRENRYYLNLIIKNEGQSTSSGYELRLNAFKLDGSPINQLKEKFENEIAVNGISSLEISLASELIIDEKAVKLFVKINPIYQDKEINQEGIEFTLEKEIQSYLEINDIPWNETRIPKEHLFKGRALLIESLYKHYKSHDRDKTYILYGLTRTGKSSVLKYLEKKIDGQTINVEGKEKKVITFFWDLSEASGQSNAQDLWAFLLYDNTISKIEKNYKGILSLPKTSVKPRFKDWKNIILHLNTENYYPLFLIDEFAYFKLLHDNGRLDQSFLAAIRQYALNGISSFIFAGTYDLKELIKNPQYGITGQLTNTIEKLISNIEEDPAAELINVISDKLEFTKEAINHILFLSGRVPYFIQIICKNCGYYAVENKRRIIGYPEVELIVKVLIGENRFSETSQITILSAGTFQNNQYSPTDTKEVNALISSICYLNKEKIIPRGVGYAELQEMWNRRQIKGFAPKLAEALDYLKDKEIIEEKEDEKVAVYQIKVDLFRRWWESQHRDIELELDILKDRS